MKQIYVLRHAPKDNNTGELTNDGREKAAKLKDKLPLFEIVIASNSKRTQETAQLLTGVEPTVDARAGHFMGTPEQSILLNERAKTHTLGFTGALFDTPEVKEDVTKKAQELIDLIHEVISKLDDGGKALIVSHDITIVPAVQLLAHQQIGTPIKTFNPLGGYIVNENDGLTLFNPSK